MPRIGFVRAFANEIDLDTSVWQALARAVAGKRAPEEISRPTGLALSNDERRLYVACAAVAKLYEFDLDNNTVRELGEAGSAGLQFPYDIAIDASDNIYVTDSTLRSVLVLDRDGHKIRQLGDAAMFVRPTGIAIDRGRDLIYVADGANRKSTHHTIEVFRRDGSHLRSIGTQGSEPGELNAPTYLAVAPGGDLYVADTMNFRVQIFHPSGAYVGHFGQQGNSPGPADRIKGMAFDAFGRLHVVASDRALVHVFSSDLQPIMWYGGRADELAFFDMPTAIAIDSNNRIYVANFHFGRVNQYQVIATSSEAASVLPSPGAEARVDVSEAADERWQGS